MLQGSVSGHSCSFPLLPPWMRLRLPEAQHLHKQEYLGGNGLPSWEPDSCLSWPPFSSPSSCSRASFEKLQVGSCHPSSVRNPQQPLPERSKGLSGFQSLPVQTHWVLLSPRLSKLLLPDFLGPSEPAAQFVTGYLASVCPTNFVKGGPWNLLLLEFPGPNQCLSQGPTPGRCSTDIC